VPGVREDRAGPHPCKVRGRDHGGVPRGGDEYLAFPCGLFHGHDREPVHVGLESLPRVDLGHDHPSPEPVQFPCKPAAAEPVPRDDDGLSCHEHVRREHDPCESALPCPVNVVEVPLHGGVVHRDHRERESPLAGHRPQPVDTGRRLLAAAQDAGEAVPPGGVEPVDQVHAVVDDDLGVRIEHPVDGRIVLTGRHPPPGIAVDARDLTEGTGHVVLRAERVAPRDVDCGPAGSERLHEARGLRLHVERHPDADPLQRLVLPELSRYRGENGHVLPRPRDLPFPGVHSNLVRRRAVERAAGIPLWSPPATLLKPA